MFVSELHIVDFRNLQQVSVDLVDGFNYFYGLNGAGKTAVLEAICLLSRGRSFRSSKNLSLIRNGTDEFMLRCVVVQPESSDLPGDQHTLALARHRSGRTQLRLDGDNQSRMSALARLLPCQILLPDSGKLVMDAPAERRAFLDWGLFHVEQEFLESSRRYRRVLAQRNAWLKEQKGSETVSVEDDPWFRQTLDLGLRLSVMRQCYVDELLPVFQHFLQTLSAELTCEITYDWGGLERAESASKKMSESFFRDVKSGVTQRGPHRGDLVFQSSGELASERVSRGQAKLIASAALIAQAALLREKTGARTVFLIDDFGAELDSNHWDRFVRTLVDLNCQVIANSTTPLDTNQAWVQDLDEYAMFHVEHGVTSQVQTPPTGRN